MKMLDLTNISFGFDKKRIIDDLSWSIQKHSFDTIIGKSGSGKSTLLQIASGLITSKSCKVLFCGEKISAPHPEMSFVFQRPNLLEWLSVEENVLLPLRLKKKIKKTDQDEAYQILQTLGIENYIKRPVWQLSGGQQSRVAIARSLIGKPKLVFMDEPFSSLDAITREELQIEIRSIHEKMKLTTVFVTHDLEEAVLLSDRVNILHQGKFVYSDAVVFDQCRNTSLKELPHYSDALRRLRQSFQNQTLSSIHN